MLWANSCQMGMLFAYRCRMDIGKKIAICGAVGLHTKAAQRKVMWRCGFAGGKCCRSRPVFRAGREDMGNHSGTGFGWGHGRYR